MAPIQAARPQFDPTLNLVTDHGLCGERGLVATAAAALAGGITLLQYRAKEIPIRRALAEAIELVALARAHGVPMIVNDRLDLALAAEADGLHLGASDMPPAVARHLLGERRILGWSVTCAGDLAEVDPAVIDYVGLGPVFATSTKPDAAPPLGLDGFRALRGEIPVPVIGIGGIDIDRTLALIAAGADGVAVISAICGEDDPERAARRLRQTIEAARGER
ncbi:MAG TPA: thiamine phosphate synthase [Dongiaceae bacterium]|jgi:thiamine-phosphate pyrophosphorylase